MAMALHSIKKKRSNSLWCLPLILPGILALFTGCSLPVADSEAGNPTVISANTLIQLPSALTKDSPPVTGSSPRQSNNDLAVIIYESVRYQNYFVNELVNGSDQSIKTFLEEDIRRLPWPYIKEHGVLLYDSASFHFEATFDKTLELSHQVTIKFNDPVFGYMIKTAFSGNAENPKGWIYYFTDYTGDFRTDSLEMLVLFEKTDTSRQLDIEIDQKLLIPSEDLAQSFSYSWYQNDGVIHLSGISYHPYLDSILKDTVGYCYTYRAVADSSKNLAIVNLGLPPASYPDTAFLFTTYGIANAYGNYFINYSIPMLDDTGKMLLATSVKDTLTLLQILVKIAVDPTFTLHDPSEADSLTIADLILYLEINKGILEQIDEANKKQYIGLLWILKLTQPVYFNANGYAGNGETVPSGFTDLAAIPCNRPKFIPTAIKDLQIVIPQQ